MRAKFVFEAIKHLPGRPQEEIDKSIKNIVDSVKKHFNYLQIGEPNLSEDDTLSVWFNVDAPELGEGEGITLWAVEEESGVKVKFYYDSVAFDGDTLNDEYMTSLEPKDIEDFSKEDFDAVIKQVREYLGLDEEDGEEDEEYNIRNKDSEYYKNFRAGNAGYDWTGNWWNYNPRKFGPTWIDPQ